MDHSSPDFFSPLKLNYLLTLYVSNTWNAVSLLYLLNKHLGHLVVKPLSGVAPSTIGFHLVAGIAVVNMHVYIV